MFGRSTKPTEPQRILRCSFCKRGEEDVRNLIAGPEVYICDACVDVCVEIIADDRHAESARARNSQPSSTPQPESYAWCAFCAGVADLETAVLIENRTLLCDSCIQAVALAASEAQRQRETKE